MNRKKEIDIRMSEIDKKLQEIESFKSEKRDSIENLNEDEVSNMETVVKAKEDEKESLNEERKALEDEKAKIEDAETEARGVADGTVATTEITPENEERKMEYTRDSIEYRDAWLNKLRGVELSEVEQRAWDTTGSAISTLTANDILKEVKDNSPLLGLATVIYSASQITYYVEGTDTDAIDHVENAAITAAADTLNKVVLNPSEIVKLVQVSEAAKMMSVNAFETWLTANLGEAIAKKINAKLIALMATGTSAGTAFSTATVQALLGAIKGTATLVCNRKTLYVDILPLQDTSKTSIVKFDGGQALVYGTPVVLEDGVADDTLLCGDISKIVAAMGENVSIRNAFDIDTNSYKFLGVAMFDAKVGFASSFAKIVKA